MGAVGGEAQQGPWQGREGHQRGLRLGQGWRATQAPCPTLEFISQALQEKGALEAGTQQGRRQGQGWRAGPAPCPSLGLLSQGIQGQALQEEGAPAPTALHGPH